MAKTPKEPAPRRSHPSRVQTSLYLSAAGLKAVKRLALDLDLRTNDVFVLAISDFLPKHGIGIDVAPPKVDDE